MRRAVAFSGTPILSAAAGNQGNCMDIRYLNTDLEIESKSDLSKIVQEFGDDVSVVYHGEQSVLSSTELWCEKLGELVSRQSYLKVKKIPATDGSPNAHVYVRIK